MLALVTGGLVVAEAARQLVEVDCLELVLGDRQHLTELPVLLDARQFHVVASCHVLSVDAAAGNLLVGLRAIEGFLGAMTNRECVLEVATNLGQPIFVGSRSIHALGDLGDGDLQNSNQAVELGRQPVAVLGRTEGLGELGSVVMLGVHVCYLS